MFRKKDNGVLYAMKGRERERARELQRARDEAQGALDGFISGIVQREGIPLEAIVDLRELVIRKAIPAPTAIRAASRE